MQIDYKHIIFHIDANSAFLSWEAINRIQHGEIVDLRQISSIVGGDPVTRHGIVLAKSIPAKKFGIKTGESLFSALRKCPKLTIVRPNYDLYFKCSNAMVYILRQYSPYIQRYSVDECFVDIINKDSTAESVLQLAYGIKERIKKELGFTVNIGISTNKLLAKMASDFEKPDKVHTLYMNEIDKKMWPLPIEDLFMVGRATSPKLRKLGINTIGDLAKYDFNIIKHRLKSHGIMIYNYAHGIEDSQVKSEKVNEIKGIGNSTTISFDVTDRQTAYNIIISLTETVAMRLRDAEKKCRLVAVGIKNNEFITYGRQRKLLNDTDSTNEIIKIAKILFDELWKGEPIRHLSVRVSELSDNKFNQISLFVDEKQEKEKELDKAVDNIRLKYGNTSIVRSVFLHSGLKSISGGIGNDKEYPLMSSIL